MKIRLGEVIEEYSVRNKDNQDIPVYSVTNTQGFCTDYFSKEIASKDKATYKIVPRGYFAYNPSRINVGSVDWQHFEDQVIVSPLYVVFGVSSRIDPRYLLHYLKSDITLTYIKTYATGSVRDNLKISVLKEFPIDLRTIEEQRHIASVLDRIDDLIGKNKSKIEKLDELVKSRFVEMFGGISDSKKYPYKLLKELTGVISGGTPSRDINEYWEGGTIPWVKTTELQNNIIAEVEEFITEEGLNNSSAKVVPSGTILIAMYGQGKTRGMTAYLGIEACTNQACACILPSDTINQTYLWQFFMLSYNHLRGMAKGGNQPNLNGNIIKNYPVLYPSQKLQEQFVAFVQETDKSKLAVQKSLRDLELLKKSKMQEYFS